MKPSLADGMLMPMPMLFLLLMLLLGGCAGTPSVRTVQVLENSGTEFPTMCMLLQSDGSLLFKGGFDFYNPGTWRRDGEVLVITVGGKAPFPAALYKEQLPRHIGGLTGYNEARREVTYRFGASTEFINFDNFYFYRAERCQAQ